MESRIVIFWLAETFVRSVIQWGKNKMPFSTLVLHLKSMPPKYSMFNQVSFLITTLTQYIVHHGTTKTLLDWTKWLVVGFLKVCAVSTPINHKYHCLKQELNFSTS